MKSLRSYPFYTFLLALFLCLHITQENVGYITPKEFSGFLLILLTCIGLLFAVVWFLSRSVLYAGFTTFVLAVPYLFFGAIKSGVQHFGFLGRYVFLLPFLFLFVVGVIIGSRRKMQFLSKATLFLNILLIAYCLLDAGIILKKHFAQQEEIFLNEVQVELAQIKDKPNVYFLLFDEYAGYNSLSKKFGFKNDTFYGELAKDSFTILPVFSNYSITAFSMSTMFNMDYVSGLAYGDTVGWHQTRRRMNEIKAAKIFDIFKGLGYTVNTYSLFDIGVKKSSGANKFFQGYKDLFTFNLFHNVITRDLGWHLGTGKHAREWMQEYLMEDLPVYNDRIEDGLLKAINTVRGPQFTYAHFLMPHPPFLFDSNGVRKPIANHFVEGSWYNNDQYVSYLKYCNKKMIGYERSILKNDSNAIVVLMSDHGVRFDTTDFVPMAFNNFCAVRFPGKQETEPVSEFSNVNFFRYLFNENFNQRIPYLQDSIIFLNEVDQPAL